MKNDDKGPSGTLARDRIDRLLSIMAQLRDPETGCPWDLRQDFSSIAPYTIEEAYEVADAIEHHDLAALKDELGDLLFQVVFHARMAEEQQAFDFPDVVAAICDKMVRRHPHVFDAADTLTTEQQTVAWETLKRNERLAAGDADRSVLAGVARGIPEWQRAAKLQSRAARAGFQWQTPEPIIEKLKEELDEVRAAFDGQATDGGHERLLDEIGDVLFVCINLARQAKVDPGRALRHANSKFERRFRAMEALAEAEGVPFAALPLTQQEMYWRRVKMRE